MLSMFHHGRPGLILLLPQQLSIRIVLPPTFNSQLCTDSLISPLSAS